MLGVTYRTTSHHSDAPVWNEPFFLYVQPNEVAQATLRLTVRTKDRFGVHCLGEVGLVLASLQPNVRHDMWHDIYAEASESQIPKRAARLLRDAGWQPNLPIVLVPGFASTALKIVHSEPNPAWEGELAWLSISRLGSENFKRIQAAVGSAAATLRSKLSSKKTTMPEEKFTETLEDSRFRVSLMQHLMLNPNDGCSDPQGIQVRAITEKIGAMYLDPGNVMSMVSWVLGPLIENLEELGYVEGINMEVCPYDWRLPPHYLEQRDLFFSLLKQKVERLVAVNNGKKVCLVGHSMGNRTIQYFLRFVEAQPGGSEWLESHVESFVAVGPPFLGAPKALRSLVSGDRLGIDALIGKQEAIDFGRSLGSAPHLLPIGQEYYFHDKGCSFVYVEQVSGDYKPVSVQEALSLSGAMKPLEFLHKYYLDSPLFGGPEGHEVVLDAPPVKRLLAIYGVNLPTEKMYFFKESNNTLALRSAKPSMTFPGYKMSKKGIAFETELTPQPNILQQTGVEGTRSGDGTVPYESLNYCARWKDKIPDLKIQELNKVEHRDILKNKLFWQLLIDHIASAPPEAVSQAEEPTTAVSGPLGSAINLICPDNVEQDLGYAAESASSGVETLTPMQSDVIKAGFLTKQREHLKTWVKQFFEVHRTQILFFSAPSATHPKGVIPVHDVVGVTPIVFKTKDGSHPGLVISTKDRQLNAYASNKAEADEWTAALRCVVSRSQTKETVIATLEPEFVKAGTQRYSISGTPLVRRAEPPHPAPAPAPEPATLLRPLARTPSPVAPEPAPQVSETVAQVQQAPPAAAFVLYGTYPTPHSTVYPPPYGYYPPPWPYPHSNYPPPACPMPYYPPCPPYLKDYATPPS
eukprot:TRINITY_DN7707_c0_g2_i2.p1 TRINITY_DN7707_c0_g2~~TRINITY_DN7707_c0_g2_i2.p1  ORF type:complete len:861 (-),score=134.88 TRINITY_DN7707_c0_g2_i2:51-2633(-)